MFIHFFFWLMGFFFLFHIPLCRSKDNYNKNYPKISVIIPARNEENALPNLLASLNKRAQAEDEIIVVDDSSEDNTRQIALENGATVVDSEPLPKGWMGKNWACYQGANQATGDIFIFLDADTIIEGNGLKKMVDSFIYSEAIISIQPYHRVRRLYEELSAFFNIILMAAVGSFTILGNKIKPIGLFGPAMVLKREKYITSGGHSKVRGEILEDLAFGAKEKKKGTRIFCYGGKGTISFRMYPNGLKELITGWSKGFAEGAKSTSIPVLLMIIAWITGAIGTVRNLIQAGVISDISLTTLWGLLYIAYAIQIYWMLYRIGNFKPYTALLFPIPLLFFIIIFAYSFIIIFIRKNVSWKGRTIRVAGKESNAHTSSDNYNHSN